MVAVRPVRQGRRRLRRLQGSLTIAGPHFDAVVSGGDAGAELPEAPGVGGELGLQIGGLLGGAVMTETVFAWPGIGRLTYEAVIYRDFPLLQAVIILKSILILSINLGVDILYAYVDPRIRLA